jgi:Zn-dependent peptidase ImmA (M78 family)
MSLSPAERLLVSLGVEAPDEIDLEAIAWTLGVKVRYEPLELCDARIVGADTKAIVTINNTSPRGRQRFSLGHELGHWHFDQGKTLICQAQDIDNHSAHALNPERIADGYSADLLMPRYLFDAALRTIRKLNFSAIRGLAEKFDVSLTAAAIRVVESRGIPALLVCHGINGRQWFRRSPLVSDKWFPQRSLDRDSPAFDVLFGGRSDTLLPQKINADAWFDRHDASWFELQEQTVRSGIDQTLTLLIIEDERMLEQ